MTEEHAEDPDQPSGVPAVVGGHRTLRHLLWLATTIFALSFLAFVAKGADGPADPFLAEPFPAVAFRITGFDGMLREFCGWLAADDDSRRQGMIGREDLAGHDGLVLQYEEPSAPAFHMRGVPIPLSIAFFDAEGLFLGALGMEPCPADAEDCPAYPPPAPFLLALEVPEGELPGMGVGDGAVIEVGGPCTAEPAR